MFLGRESISSGDVSLEERPNQLRIEKAFRSSNLRSSSYGKSPSPSTSKKLATILFLVINLLPVAKVESFTLNYPSTYNKLTMSMLKNLSTRFTHSHQLFRKSYTRKTSSSYRTAVQMIANEISTGHGLKFPCTQSSTYKQGPTSLQSDRQVHTHSPDILDDHHTIASSQYESLFTLDLPEGKCVGLILKNPHQAPSVPTSLYPEQIKSNSNHWINNILHPDEVKYGFKLSSENSRLTFYIGRIAMRTALAHMKGIDSQTSVEYEDRLGGFTKLPNVSTSDQSILKDEHGRPQVPTGFIGSISHKQTTGVALISTLPAGVDNGKLSKPTIGVGVDIEQTFSRRRNIAKKILTPNELEDIGKLDGVTRDEEVLLRFSLKESVYKAMHPLICQFVGFQEAEITPHNDGTASVKLMLKSGKHEEFQEVEAHWRRIKGDFFLTSSRVTLKQS